jgi:hypothetical protein
MEAAKAQKWAVEPQEKKIWHTVGSLCLSLNLRKVRDRIIVTKKKT